MLAARNPRIILTSVSGWGHGNSRSDQGAYASAIHAEAGFTEIVARRRGDAVPRNDPPSHSDVYGGMHTLAALLAAVHMRDRTGKGQSVEVSMAESTLVANDLVSSQLTGEDPMVGFKGGQNWSPIFRLANGRFVNVTIDSTTNAAFAIWCRAMNRPELADDPRFAEIETRVANRAALEAEIATWVVQFDSAEALEKAIGVSTVLCAEVRTPAELAATPWAAERGAFVTVDTGRGEMVTVPQSPWRFSDADSGVVPYVGFRGDDNRAVLAELAGASEAEIAALEAEGVVSARPPRWREGS